MSTWLDWRTGYFWHAGIYNSRSTLLSEQYTSAVASSLLKNNKQTNTHTKKLKMKKKDKKQNKTYVFFPRKGWVKMAKRWCVLTNFTEITEIEFNKISSKYAKWWLYKVRPTCFSHILTPILTIWSRRVTKILLRDFRPGGGALTWKEGMAYVRPSWPPFHACPTVHKTPSWVTICPFTKPSFERKMWHFPPKQTFF